MITFRDTITRIVPWWLRGAIAGRILYVLGLHLDAVLQGVVMAVRRRFPGADPAYEDALPTIGRERRIRRGRNEPAENYTPRLVKWLDAHANRGGPYALLNQLRDFYAQDPFRIELVYRSGRYFDMVPGQEITRGFIGWAPDVGLDERWAEWWLVYHWPTAVDTDGIWSDPGDYDDGGVWDVDLTIAEVEDLRLVPQEWNAGHTIGHVVLLFGTVELWDAPPGIWDDPGVWSDNPATVSLRID